MITTDYTDFTDYVFVHRKAPSATANQISSV
jgi:hypothetical protein